MKLWLIWKEPPAGDFDKEACHLCFDSLVWDDLRERGAHAEFVDHLLTWDDRHRIEEEAAALVGRILTDSRLAQARDQNSSISAAAEYPLRAELTNLLRCYAAVERLAALYPVVEVAVTDRCPSTTVLGAQAALEILPAPTDQDWVQNRWTPVLSVEEAAGRFRRLLESARLPLAQPRQVRLLVFPGGKVADALSALTGPSLREMGVALGILQGMAGMQAARIALRARVPLVVLRLRRSFQSPPATSVALPALLSDHPPLDAATRVVANAVLAGAAATVARVAPAIDQLELQHDCRAILLPNSSTPLARLLTAWARRRGVRVGVVQHGVYGWRDWDTGDRLADVVLSWGPGVVRQVAESPRPHPDVVPVGVPGLPMRRRPPGHILRRVLVVTTNAPIGSALGTHGLAENYMATIAPGLRHLTAAGVAIQLRHHPAEETARYQRLVDNLELSVRILRRGTLVDAACEADLVVSPTSSAAFEAAALGVPVAMWRGDAPAKIRRAHLLPPFSDDLVGTFEAKDDFAAFALSLARGEGSALSNAEQLSTELRDYAVPFDAMEFQAALQHLSD